MVDWLKSHDMTARQMVDLPPVWLVGSILLVWGVAWVWPSAMWITPLFNVTGTVLFWAGLALMGWAIWTFRSHHTTVVPHQVPRAIITDGPFRFSRNPIYLGDLMVLAGVVLGQGAVVMIWIVPLLGMILARRFIAPEEARMKQNFGDKFLRYKEITPLWIGKPRG